MSSKFSFRWSPTIDEISSEDWMKIYGDDVIKSYSFMKANEVAKFDEVSFHYLQVFKDNQTIAIVPCFAYGMDLFNIASSGKVKTKLEWIRKIYPQFFKIRTFVTGSYAATCEHFIEYSSELSENEKKIVTEIIGNEIKKQSIKEKSHFVFVKDVRERSIELVKGILTNDYKFFISFPTTVIPIIHDIPYPGALRKKNRKRYRIYKELFDQRFHWEKINDFGGKCVQQFTELYSIVLAKAKNKFEFLNEKFFETINDFFADESFLLVAKDNSTDEIRVMVMVFENDENLIPLYMGFNYKGNDSKILYLNMIFKIIEEAEALGKHYVDLGQTSYYPKTMSGALVENIYYGFWSHNTIMRWLINHGLGKMFAPPTVPEHVYLEKYAAKAHNVLTDRGFVLLN